MAVCMAGGLRGEGEGPLREAGRMGQIVGPVGPVGLVTARR
jgi:hypothetical protein